MNEESLIYSNEVTDSVWDEIKRDLANYSVSLIRIVDNDRSDGASLAGSGTLVNIGSERYILTAGHVWQNLLNCSSIGLVYTTYLSCLRIPFEALSAKSIWGKTDRKWGPDIALIKLPAVDASELGAKKSFFNLGRRREELLHEPPCFGIGPWIIVGMVAAFSKIPFNPKSGRVEADINCRAFIGNLEEQHEQNGYDYLDIGADHRVPGVPEDFSGLSGGALWQVALSKSPDGHVIYTKRFFHGVAYWQSPPCADKRVIRCHGTESIFTIVWKEWGLLN